MNTHYIVQTRAGKKYLDLFKLASRNKKYDRLDVAVAYATLGGVRKLEKTLQALFGEDAWNVMTKRWLVGIDWCRSDPPAMEKLVRIHNSKVRVPNGRWLVKSRGCTPRDTYHPKVYLFRGPHALCVICGSGNLSANGLARGCECGSLRLFNLNSAGETPSEVKSLRRWFDMAWRASNSYMGIKHAYEFQCRTRIQRRLIVPTEDDTKPPEIAPKANARTLTEEQIRQLRSFNNFWIEAGVLGRNLGSRRPGNQLDMKKFTRAFFGFDVEDLDPSTNIGHVTLVWGRVKHSDSTLKFGDNGMDKLNVPMPGSRGDFFYEGKTLLFTRKQNGAFGFEAGDIVKKRILVQKSRKLGVVHKMSSGRLWGLF